MESCSHPLCAGSSFRPGDGGFKDEGVLALPIHPGVVTFGTWIRWRVGPRFYAGGGHALGKEFLYNVHYFAWFNFHFPCAGCWAFSNLSLLVPPDSFVALSLVVIVHFVDLVLELFVLCLEHFRNWHMGSGGQGWVLFAREALHKQESFVE
eukprot:1155584-Pelagomonas_calceolata.AAC.1